MTHAEEIPDLATVAIEDNDARVEPRRDVRFLLGISSVLLACAVLLVVGQIILRFVFNNPRAWAEEVGRYLFVWMVFVGCGVATARGSHIRVTEVVDWFGDAGRRFSHWLGFGSDVICNIVLIYAGSAVAWKNRFVQFYSLDGFPQVVFYVALPLGGLLMLIYQFRRKPAAMR
ncbi:TRAP transporter small permease [Falsiroseomonas sp. HW251]|uniref:TRAP transporter small permease n=1 Tax=Falsiroseomonas sp. HW251 TaxID=3390998 RepID=UPI003D319EB8